MTERDMNDAIQRELEPQETVVWTGQPNPGRMAKQALPALIFAIPWLGITSAVSWGFLGHANSSPGFPMIGFLLFISIFWLIGLGLVFSPLFALNSAKRIVYAITDKRVLILTVSKVRKLDSYKPSDLCNFEHIEPSDGSGNLTFARRAVAAQRNGPSSVPVSFVGIPQVRSVETLMRQTFEGANQSPGTLTTTNDMRPIGF
jgi:hypothetical protein